MQATLIGVTGATGKDLLQLLLNDTQVEQVTIFVRRAPAIQHEKLKTHLIDFDQPSEWSHLVQGDVLFSCLGTTLKAAGSKEAQRKVDYYYQLQFAKAARENNVPAFVLVSSEYASSKSPFFYPKIKGELEDEVKKLNFPKLIIFNPPLLDRAGSDRKGEVVAMKIAKFFNAVGLLKSMQPLSTKILAQAMLHAAKTFRNGAYSIKGQKIREYAKKSLNCF